MNIKIEREPSHLPIDQGSLVESKDESMLIMVDDWNQTNAELFSGTVISGGEPYLPGRFRRDWNKIGFKRFAGTITMKQGG